MWTYLLPACWCDEVRSASQLRLSCAAGWVCRLVWSNTQHHCIPVVIAIPGLELIIPHSRIYVLRCYCIGNLDSQPNDILLRRVGSAVLDAKIHSINNPAAGSWWVSWRLPPLMQAFSSKLFQPLYFETSLHNESHVIIYYLEPCDKLVLDPDKKVLVAV